MTDFRINPDTCPHNTAVVFSTVVLCFNCEAELSLEYRMQFHWAYDHVNDLWVIYHEPFDSE